MASPDGAGNCASGANRKKRLRGTPDGPSYRAGRWPSRRAVGARPTLNRRCASCAPPSRTSVYGRARRGSADCAQWSTCEVGYTLGVGRLGHPPFFRVARHNGISWEPLRDPQPEEVYMPSMLCCSAFCADNGLSRSLFYRLLRDGRGPRLTKVGRRSLISAQAAAEWRARMERETEQSARSPKASGPGGGVIARQRHKSRRSTWRDDPGHDPRLTILVARPPISQARVLNSGLVTWPLLERGWAQVGETYSWPNPWWNAEWAWSRSYFDLEPEHQPRSRKVLEFQINSGRCLDLPKDEELTLNRMSPPEGAGQSSSPTTGPLTGLASSAPLQPRQESNSAKRRCQPAELAPLRKVI